MTDMELIVQPIKNTYLKMELVNSVYIVLQEIQGDLIDIGLTISAQSDIRRVVSATMHIENEDQLVSEFFGAWLDRMVRVHYGIYDPDRKTVVWFLLGSLLFTASSYTIDLGNKRLSLQMGDMMTQLSEQRGSQIGTPIEFSIGSRIDSALEAVIARFAAYKRTNICAFPDTVPYKVEVPRAAYPLQAANTLIELFPWFEHFYSKDGIYTVQEVPITYGQEVAMTASDLQKVVISENGNADYSAIKNSTEIWGKEIDANYTALNCNESNGVYTLQIQMPPYEYGAIVSFVPNVGCIQGQKLCASGQAAYPIVKEDGLGQELEIQAGELAAGRAYCVKYKNQKFYLMGETQIHVMCMEYSEMPSDSVVAGLRAFYNCNDIRIIVEPESAFACDKIGVVNQVLEGGDYANIYTTELAFERAAYENWKKTRILDTITIETLFVPWLDVNQKVEYRSIGTGETNQYMIQQIEMRPLSGTMTVQLSRFLPLYPWLG